MNVVVSGHDIRAIIGDFRQFIKDVSPMLERIGDEVVFPSLRENFDKEGRPKWDGLAERTRMERISQGYDPDHPILQRTGELLKTSATKEGAYLDLTEKRYVISPLLKKAEWLNDGLGKLPARQFFMLQDDDYQKIDRLVNKYIMGELQKAIKSNSLTDLEGMYR